MNKINLVLQKLPLKEFLKSNRIEERFDIHSKTLKEDIKHLQNNLEGIKSAWEREPNSNLGNLLINKGYLKDDPILSDVNEVKWLYVNGHISTEEYNKIK